MESKDFPFTLPVSINNAPPFNPTLHDFLSPSPRNPVDAKRIVFVERSTANFCYFNIEREFSNIVRTSTNEDCHETIDLLVVREEFNS